MKGTILPAVDHSKLAHRAAESQQTVYRPSTTRSSVPRSAPVVHVDGSVTVPRSAGQRRHDCGHVHHEHVVLVGRDFDVAEDDFGVVELHRE